MSDTVINVKGLSKRYGDVEAGCGIDLEVRRGGIFAFLGPNARRIIGGSQSLCSG